MMPIFMDLKAIAVNENLISSKTEEGKWTAISYKTKLGTGILLTASENVYPDEDIVFDLKLEGWHRIYLCMVNHGGDTYTHIKLSDDLCFSGMRTSPKGSPHVWMPYEYMQEFYWKSADLSGQRIVLKKPEIVNPHISNLVWIRCEKIKIDDVVTYYRTLSIDNTDISSFNPSWKG